MGWEWPLRTNYSRSRREDDPAEWNTGSRRVVAVPIRRLGRPRRQLRRRVAAHQSAEQVDLRAIDTEYSLMDVDYEGTDEATRRQRKRRSRTEESSRFEHLFAGRIWRRSRGVHSADRHRHGMFTRQSNRMVHGEEVLILCRGGPAVRTLQEQKGSPSRAASLIDAARARPAFAELRRAVLYSASRRPELSPTRVMDR